jgi:hypothetical protein
METTFSQKKAPIPETTRLGCPAPRTTDNSQNRVTHSKSLHSNESLKTKALHPLKTCIHLEIVQYLSYFKLSYIPFQFSHPEISSKKAPTQLTPIQEPYIQDLNYFTLKSANKKPPLN